MISQAQNATVRSHILTLDEAEKKPGTMLVEPISVVRRSCPAFVLDLSGENFSHHLHHEHPIELGGILKSEWNNVVFFGWNVLHAFVDEEADLVSQDIVGTASRVDLHIAHQPGPAYPIPRMKRDGDTVTLDFETISDEMIRRCSDDVYFGTPIEPLNWGMWLLHCVPSAADYIASGHRGLFGCWSKLEWQRKLLHFMGIEDEKLLQVDEWTTHVAGQLTFRTYPRIDLFVGQRDRNTFTEIGRRCLAKSQVTRPSRIFVSRQAKSLAGSARRLLNEAELADALQAIGFMVVEPELLAFEDQVALFASATVIVGLGGAGLFNAVFAKPGTKLVTIEASNAFIHNHANLFSSLSLDYAVIFGKRVALDDRWPHHDWTLDVPRTIAQIQQFI